MKKIFFFFCIIMCMSVNAQKLVEFKLQQDGTFKTEDGSPYAVIEFPGKTAEELYNMVKSNAMSYYKNPKEVLSENENSIITIRAIKEAVSSIKVLMIRYAYSAHYNLTFRFKDGKIRCDAPNIDDYLIGSAPQLPPESFRSVTNRLFNKNGEVKDKNVAKKQYHYCPVKVD